MRIVVTGAAGFVGSHLCEALVADGHDVEGVDCLTDYYAADLKRENLAGLLGTKGFEFSETDLRTADLEALLDGADAVINEAATPGLMLSWTDFERYQSTNVSAVKRLLDACVAVGVGHLVQASTSSVYGTLATGPEDSVCRPVSPYGITKLAAEHLIRAYGESFGVPFTILRYFSIYGPRQRPDMAYRIFCERLVRGESITVHGDGRQSRSNTYVADAVAATIAALMRPPNGSTFNIGGGREIELLEAIRIIASRLGVEPVVEFAPTRPGDQRRTVADISAARRELAWEPEVEPEQGLRAEVDWIVGRSISGGLTEQT